MKVLQINTVYAEGSTGNIVKSIHDACVENGIECLCAQRCIKKGDSILDDSVSVSSKWDSRIHGWLSRFTMFKGAGSVLKTALFLRKVKKFSPDVIHLHNLHGSYINLPQLFSFIKKNNIPVVWTVHDCWPVTAICSHFMIAGCNKWQSGCHNCSQKKRFSSAPIDMTKYVWRAKQQWFTDVPEMTVVTPSDWLKGIVEKSFLKEYKVKTIYNGINRSVFKQTASDFRVAYGIENKKIVLGVAFDWSYAKGLDVFIDLSKRLDDDYRIVLVGTNDETDHELPKNIISIHRTANQQQLAEIYTAADVFVNPTREEALGLVNIEALACGTPVITFRTGGSPECIDSSCGVVVENESIDQVEQEIVRICTYNPYSKEDCVRRADLFDGKQRIEEYISLYKNIVKSV